MTLQQLWDEQYELQQLWHDWTVMSEVDRDALVKELLLNLHKQANDLQLRTDQSSYHILKQKRDMDPYMLAHSGVGVLKLLVAVMLLRGVRPEMFARAWGDVAVAVRAKWKWEQDELAKAEVLLCDLDGVVAKYTDGFKAWCDARDVKIHGDINTPDLEPIKDEFHSCGGFRTLQPVPGAIATLNKWRMNDAATPRRLVMVTARPYRQYRQVYGDTVYWLDNHHLKYDHILFERDKAEAVRQVHPARIVSHIEDRGKHALEVAATGVTVLKLPFAGHEETIAHPNIRPVAGWDDIAAILEAQ